MKVKYHIVVLFLIILLSYSNASMSCSNIKVIGTFDSSTLSFAFTEKVILSRDKTKAFVSDGGAGLQILDISDLTNPILIGNYDVNYTKGEIVKEAVLSSDESKVFISTHTGGLKVVDISNMANPTLLGENNLSNGLALGIAISNDDSTAYIANSNGGFKVVDVSNLANPVVISELNSSVVGTVKSVTLSNDGTKAFIATLDSGIKIINISNRNDPVLINRYDTYYAQHIILSSDETKAFVSDSFEGLKILDISDDMNITLISSLDINGTAMHVSLSDDGTKAFVADFHRTDTSKGVQIINISDIYNPSILNSFPTGQTKGVTFYPDNKIFVASGHGGLKILECPQISTPTPTPTPTPSLTSTSISTPSPTLEPRQNIDTLNDGVSGKICFGDKVWEDLDRDGIQDSDELGIENVKVTLYRGDCITELNTTRTDILGNYLFSNLKTGDYCVGFSEFPSEYADYIATFKNRGSDDSRDSDVNRDNNKTDRFTLNHMEENECNISIDMGIYIKRECEEIILYDDVVDANKNSSITEIDALSNDTISTNGQTIKFLNISDAEILWQEEGIVPADTKLLDTLTIKGEGVWRVEDGMINFIADDEFKGQIPSAIYYIVKSPSCDGVVDSETRLSNIAQVKISSPCCCKAYNNSVSSLNKVSIIALILLSTILGLWFIGRVESRREW